MSNRTKQIVIAVLSAVFLLSLIFVQWMEVSRRQAELGLAEPHIIVPSTSERCVECHMQSTPAIVNHWKGSTHAQKGVGCYECHKADGQDADSYPHEGYTIATVVTPRDCGYCHKVEMEQFARSHHAAGGNILASLDNYLAETVEGARVPFNSHGAGAGKVNGMASAISGCMQCHGGKVALASIDGGIVIGHKPPLDPVTKEPQRETPDGRPLYYLDPDPETGKPRNAEAVAKIMKTAKEQRPVLDFGTWPNTGIGRLNLDGSLGSCSACHSRHDFSPRRARQPENCGKCHLGPDHPQKEIYEESKHGVAYRDLREKMNLNSPTWVLGKDYSHAPTCATCHMSGHSKNEGRITHDPGERISWTNRPWLSYKLDTDVNGKLVKETDPKVRSQLVVHSAQDKRNRMTAVCQHCHTPGYVDSFYKQYDDLVALYNEKFARPGNEIIQALRTNNLITATDFDEEIEWTWFYLWHHEGRRARHGASMMAPDYTHWHGMYEVAERFYMGLIPQAKEIAHEAEKAGKVDEARAVSHVIEGIMSRPEHSWPEHK